MSRERNEALEASTGKEGACATHPNPERISGEKEKSPDIAMANGASELVTKPSGAGTEDCPASAEGSAKLPLNWDPIRVVTRSASGETIGEQTLYVYFTPNELARSNVASEIAALGLKDGQESLAYRHYSALNSLLYFSETDPMEIDLEALETVPGSDWAGGIGNGFGEESPFPVPWGADWAAKLGRGVLYAYEGAQELMAASQSIAALDEPAVWSSNWNTNQIDWLAMEASGHDGLVLTEGFAATCGPELLGRGVRYGVQTKSGGMVPDYLYCALQIASGPESGPGERWARLCELMAAYSRHVTDTEYSLALEGLEDLLGECFPNRKLKELWRCWRRGGAGEIAAELANRYCGNIIYAEGAFRRWDGKVWHTCSVDRGRSGAVAPDCEMGRIIAMAIGRANIRAGEVADRLRASAKLSLPAGARLNSGRYRVYLNGTYDVRERKFMRGEFVKSHYMTGLVQVEIPAPGDRAALTPVFDEYLGSALGSEEKIEHFLRTLGYSFFEENSLQTAVVYYGPRASNGKSIAVHILKAMNETSDSTESGVLTDFTVSELRDTHSVPALRSSLINVAFDDQNVFDPSSEERFKALVSGEPFGARLAHGRRESIHTQCKWYMATNNLPTGITSVEAYAKRVEIVPFEYVFTSNPKRSYEKAEDPELLSKIIRELPGVILKAMGKYEEMWADYLSNSERAEKGLPGVSVFRTPECSQELLDQFRASSNPAAQCVSEIARYFESMKAGGSTANPHSPRHKEFHSWEIAKMLCEAQASRSCVLASEIYDQYKDWCRCCEIRCPSPTWFGRRFNGPFEREIPDFERGHDRRGTVYKPIK